MICPDPILGNRKKKPKIIMVKGQVSMAVWLAGCVIRIEQLASSLPYKFDFKSTAYVAAVAAANINVINNM